MTRIWVARDEGSDWLEFYTAKPVIVARMWETENDEDCIGTVEARDWFGPTPDPGRALCVEMTVVEEPK